jgi:hypothetical protein
VPAVTAVQLIAHSGGLHLRNTTEIGKIIYGWIADSLSSTNNQLPAAGFATFFTCNLPALDVLAYSVSMAVTKLNTKQLSIIISIVFDSQKWTNEHRRHGLNEFYKMHSDLTRKEEKKLIMKKSRSGCVHKRPVALRTNHSEEAVDSARYQDGTRTPVL